MGQADIIELLKKKKEWVDSKEISKLLDISYCNVNRSLKIIYEKEKVNFNLKRRLKKNKNGYEWYLDK